MLVILQAIDRNGVRQGPRVTYGVVTVKVNGHWPGAESVPAGMVPPVRVIELGQIDSAPCHHQPLQGTEAW